MKTIIGTENKERMSQIIMTALPKTLFVPFHTPDWRRQNSNVSLLANKRPSSPAGTGSLGDTWVPDMFVYYGPLFVEGRKHDERTLASCKLFPIGVRICS